MHFAELDVLRWVHIICMVYWLGGEWGVFQTSYHVTNHRLPLEERKRHGLRPARARFRRFALGVVLQIVDRFKDGGC